MAVLRIPNQYLALNRVAKALDHDDVLEYWKSAPYLLNFMEEYDLKRKPSDVWSRRSARSHGTRPRLGKSVARSCGSPLARGAQRECPFWACCILAGLWLSVSIRSGCPPANALTANVRRSLVLYRMVFGQNRQEDLVEYLLKRLPEESVTQLVDLCRVDLSPPRRPGREGP
jgi:hypothetical protein